MLNKFKNWHSGLTKASKVVLWSAVVVGAWVFSAAASPATPTENPAPKPIVVKQPLIETKEVTETTEMPFTSSTVDDPGLEQGKTVVKTAGVKGIKTFIYKVTYEDGLEKKRELVKEEVTTQQINEVIAKGTKAPYVAPAPRSKPAPASNCDPNYSPCVPKVSYDLDCGDIGFSVTVRGSDPHGFDRDGDGYGCESN